MFIAACVLCTRLFALDSQADKPENYLHAAAVQNWKAGTVDTELELLIKQAGLKMPADRLEAVKLLDKHAPQLLKNIYLSIPVDSSHLLGNYLADGVISIDQLLTIIAESDRKNATLNSGLNKAVAYDTASLQNIASLFIKHKALRMPTLPTKTTLSEKYSGLVIDARGLLPIHGEFIKGTVQPALFPKIWDSDMNVVYEKNMVLPQVARQQAIVRYTDTLDDQAFGQLIGDKPLRIVARGIFGVNRTDIIISNEDAARLLSMSENLKLIQEGRVLIIADDLTKTPNYPQPDEQFYFAYRDVNMTIDETPGIIVTEEPDNTVLKITMYNIHFVADKADILPTDYGRLDVIADALRRLGNNVTFLIEGHTADLHRPDDQLLLSKQRAQTMAQELAKRGIDISRIQTNGYGATMPVAPSNTEANMAKNRRVEIKIMRK